MDHLRITLGALSIDPRDRARVEELRELVRTLYREDVVSWYQVDSGTDSSVLAEHPLHPAYPWHTLEGDE